MRAIPLALIATALLVSGVDAEELAGSVQKPSIDVYAQPAFGTATIATLKRDTAVRISAQQGLWYELQLPTGATGYVRVNEVRVSPAGTAEGEASSHVLLSGKAGKGRVTETAGVRGIDESDLKSAAYDQAQLDAMVGYRVEDVAAAAYAGTQGWQATEVPYATEARYRKSTGASASAPSRSASASAVGDVLGALGSNVGALFGGASKAIPKSEEELAAEELALGPQIAGRVLGARPLWNDAGAQGRVNRVGRWVAAQTSRPELPWTFGVIDTPEVNAFAAPGGYILIARGLYELLSSDSELAAVLGHEISHCVQRDHYNVIRKQELASSGKELAMSKVELGNSSPAAAYARNYVETHGATIMMSALDREAEYRADEGAEHYLARAGMNPLALYSLLQKLTALGSDSAMLAQLYKTHPPLDERIDRIDQRGFGALQQYTMRE